MTVSVIADARVGRVCSTMSATSPWCGAGNAKRAWDSLGRGSPRFVATTVLLALPSPSMSRKRLSTRQSDEPFPYITSHGASGENPARWLNEGDF